jgi:hypothetical protein
VLLGLICSTLSHPNPFYIDPEEGGNFLQVVDIQLQDCTV